MRRVAERLEPSCMAIDDAIDVLELVLENERLLGGMKVRLVRRLKDFDVAARNGERGLADWLAKKTGTSVGQARHTVDSADNVEAGSATDDALRNGAISPEQANEIGKASKADPHAERGCRLLLGELEEVAARDHEPLLLTQSVDRREQALLLLAGE